jgi:LmbE family N-acetylglucosaminyl deacetylase
MTLMNPKTRVLTSLVLAVSLALSVLNLWPAHATGIAQPAAQASGNVELHQALLDLASPWTVMCVAAHPDDEDGTTLTVLRRKLGVHTVSLFSTYGEGGQNAIGPELYEDLGVIRARETMAAAEIQGSEPHFLGLPDFGFSKSADEAFRIWGHEEALKRMVLQIRQLRPDVIITNHDTTSGHGHHQATGRMLLEAFEAAADPKRFAAQLKDGLEPWQVQRVFVRGGGGGGPANTRPQNQAGPDKVVTVDPNERDPIRGTTFIEQALMALQRHATQGPWPKSIDDWLRSRGNANANGQRTFPLTRYRLVLEAPGAGPLPQSPSNVLDGLHLQDTVAARLAPPTIEGQPLTGVIEQRSKVLVGLLVARKAGAFTVPPQMTGPVDSRRFQLMSSRLDRAIAVASGASLTLSASESVLVPGMTTTFTAGLGNSGEDAIHVKHLAFHGWGTDKDLNIADLLPAGTETSASTKAVTPKTATFTVPTPEHLYDDSLFGKRLTASATLEINGVTFAVEAATKIDVAPAVEIKSVAPAAYVFTPQIAGQPLSVNLQVINHLANQFSGTLAAPGYKSSFSGSSDLSNMKPNETREIGVSLTGTAQPGASRLGHPASADRPIELSVRRAGSQEEVTKRSVPGKFIDARVTKTLRVGYVPSFDQTLAQSLASLGVDAKELKIADVQNADLSSFNTIIIDNRGYEAHPELIAANARLLKYAEDGGTLIVFYHKNNEWNPDPNKNRPQLAPYPIVLGGERVTDETAPITFLQRDHLLEFPNAITAADFKDWIQERGLYYPRDWDGHYTALFSTNDPGEAPLKGGLLAASYGKGHYIYTSMVWYRELRAGVPGAYRMLANMISYGH